jgi:hypothetical protein
MIRKKDFLAEKDCGKIAINKRIFVGGNNY